MSDTFQIISALAGKGEIKFSEHGYDEMAEDSLNAREIVVGLSAGVVIEDYPDYGKGPCVLILQHDHSGLPVHVVWGIPKGEISPAVMITAYRPDPLRWSGDYMRRIK